MCDSTKEGKTFRIDCLYGDQLPESTSSMYTSAMVHVGKEGKHT